MNTVIARFHHHGRDLDDLESALVRAGADDAQITGYTVALTFRDGSEESAVASTHRLLDQIGATHIKIRRRKLSRATTAVDRGLEGELREVEPPSRDEPDSEQAIANLMAKLEMGVFGHP